MFYLIIAGLMIISLFLFLLIELKKSVHLFYVIPFTLFFFTGVYFYYESVLGHPTSAVFDKKFQLLAYTVNNEETKIFIWVVFRGEKEPVSMWLPYSREDHQSLEDGKGLMNKGKMMEGTLSTFEEGTEGSGKEGDKESRKGGPKSNGGMIFLGEMNQHDFIERK
jgi:hypothetical protein